MSVSVDPCTFIRADAVPGAVVDPGLDTVSSNCAALMSGAVVDVGAVSELCTGSVPLETTEGRLRRTGRTCTVLRSSPRCATGDGVGCQL